MIIILEENTGTVELSEQVVLVYEVADYNIPSGILASNFTQKGGILVGTGSGAFVELPPGADGKALVYNSGTASGVSAETFEAAFPPMFKQGLTLINNTSDANNDIDIATGACRDTTDAFNLRLTSAITKRLDAAWAVGNAQGGLDTGSKANSTWYHVWLIRKDSNGSIDALFSTSATAPTMPSGYTYKRRIGSVRTNASGNILGFLQTGSIFNLAAPSNDLLLGVQTTATAFTVTSPLGIKTNVFGIANVDSSGAAGVMYVFDPDLSSGAFFAVYSAVAGIIAYYKCLTNTSSQLKYYGSSGVRCSWYTYGWEELWIT